MCELALDGIELDLDNVLACRREGHGDPRAGVDFRANGFGRSPFAAYAQVHLSARLTALAGLTHGDLDVARRAVDDAELGCGDDLDAPVELVRPARDERVHGR